MSRFCAWCEALLFVDARGHSRASHGICAACAEKLQTRRAEDLARDLHRMADPMALVDAAGRIHQVNAPMALLLGGAADQLAGRSLRQLLRCPGSAQSTRCEAARPCSGCALEEAVAATFATGRASRRPVTLSRPGERLGRQTRVATLAAGAWVALRFEVDSA